MMESRLLPLALVTGSCLVVVTMWWWWRNSTQNASHTPKPEDVFRFKNKRASDEVIPLLFRTVLNWCLEKQGTKDDTQSFLQFIEQNSTLLKKYKKLEFFPEEKIKLCLNKNCDTFDATLLNKLIGLICPEATSNTRLKALLCEAMYVRNRISHDCVGAAVSPTLLGNIKRLTSDLIKLAGKLLKRPQQDIEAKITEALQLVFDIDKVVLTDSVSTIAAIRGLFTTTGVQESKDTWSKRHTHVVLPFSKLNVDIKNVFIKTNFSDKKAAGHKHSDVSYDELLDNLYSSTNSCSCVVVEGDAGSGKTTLLLKIAKSFLGLIIYMQCRDEHIKTAADLVKHNLPRTTRDLDMTAVMEALRGISVLIIIDGYDEINNTSRALVKELINHFSTNYSSKFLISSRSNVSKGIKTELEGRGLRFQTLVIKRLSSDDQIDLVGKYAKEIKVNSNKIKTIFKEKRLFCPEMYYPVYIALFCELFREMPNKVQNMSSGMSLMELFMKHCEGKIEERIKGEDASLHAYELFCCACDFSLKLLNQSKYIIDKKSQMELASNFKKVVNTGVSCDSVMSCIFSTKSISNTTQDVNFQFFHASQQECMAAQALLRLCSSVASADDILRQMGLTPENTKNKNLRKFLNTMNFTILTLLKEDNTEQDRLFLLLAELATRAGAKFPFWTGMLGSFPGNERVEGEAAKCNEWIIESSSVTAEATRMLSRHQPSLLEVYIPASEDTPVELRGLMEAVAVTGYSGELWLHLCRSHDFMLPCDEVLKPLKNARCELISFNGCVRGDDAWDGLTAVFEGGSKSLIVSLPEPLTHQLTNLQPDGCSVTVSHCSVDDPALDKPLPDAVQLTVLDVPASGGAAVAGLLTCLAPAGGYIGVYLTRCLLSDEELHELTGQLTGVMWGTEAVGLGVPWTEAVYSGGRCWQCRSSTHDGERRCIVIRTE